MATVTTSKGKQYNALWADEGQNGLWMEIQDTRRLPRIAAELDNLEWLKHSADGQEDKIFEGFDRIVSLTKTENRVLCHFERSVADG